MIGEDGPGNGAATGPGPGKAPGRGVLLMAYGSPRHLGEVGAYYTHMRGGHAPRPEALAELESRYRAIGGGSPLQQITREQAEALQLELERRAGERWVVTVGMKHSAPFIEDAVAELASQGVGRVVGLVLAPHYSTMSVGEYVERARQAAARSGGPDELSFVTDWHLSPGYVAWLAARVREELETIPEPRRRGALVVFTAHSLPSRLRELGDPYPEQLAETGGAVARVLELPAWTTAWQSVSNTGEPWLGPALLELVRERAASGVQDFLICACGFTADHLEILYDLDLEARQEALRLGVSIRRTRMPNADPGFISVLVDLVLEEVAAARR